MMADSPFERAFVGGPPPVPDEEGRAGRCVRVKICGITNVEDAIRAADCGADALGFNFYTKSPRCVSPETARAIIRELPPFVSSVGVFVNESVEVVNAVADYCQLDMAQLHGDEPPALCARIRRPMLKAFRVSSVGLPHLAVYRELPNLRGILLDTFVPDEPGGTGETFDWSLARQARDGRTPIILAGGLTPENVAEAIAVAAPDGVDVSSGVEARKGKKDAEKMEAFIRTVRTS